MYKRLLLVSPGSHVCLLICWFVWGNSLGIAPALAQRPSSPTLPVLQPLSPRSYTITPLHGQDPQEITREMFARIPAIRRTPGVFRASVEKDAYSESRRSAAPSLRETGSRAFRGFGEGYIPTLPKSPMPPPPGNNPPPPAPGNNPTLLRTPSPSPSWKAYDSPGDNSADTNLAVSSTHVVVTTRTTVGFFDRNGNAVKPLINILDFFGASFMSSLKVDNAFDSRCIYDPYRKRFWIGTLALNNKGQDAAFGKTLPHDRTQQIRYTLLAVSKTENPLDGWYVHYWASGKTATVDSDYLLLGIHERCIIASNTATDADGTTYSNVVFANAGAMAKGKSGDGQRFTGLQNPKTGNIPYRITPVSHHGYSPAMYLVGRDGDSVVIWAVSNLFDKFHQSVSAGSIAVAPFTSPPAAPQPGTTKTLWFDELGNDVLRAVYRNYAIYMVFNDAHDWFGDGKPLTSIRLLQVGVGNNHITPSLTLVTDRTFGKNSDLDDKPTARVYYGYPAVEVGLTGDVVIVYSRSGSTVFPEARVTARRHGGVDVLPSTVLKQGEAAYALDGTNLPWADCAGACVDPVDDKSVWVATCYATSSQQDNNFAVWVGRVKVP